MSPKCNFGVAMLGWHLIGVWIGDVWKGDFPEKCFPEADLHRKIPEAAISTKLQALNVHAPSHSIPPLRSLLMHLVDAMYFYCTLGASLRLSYVTVSVPSTCDMSPSCASAKRTASS